MSLPLPTRILSAILKIFFYLLYHQFAWTYDAVAWVVSFGRWQGWIYATLPYLPGEKILEIGHGPGHLQKALFAAGKVPVGVDASLQMNRLALNRLLKGKLKPNIINGYAQFLPFKDGSFHHVIATFPTEYIADSVSLSEIQRILMPAGSLVVLPVAFITGKSLIDRLLAWIFHITRQTPAHLDQRLLDDLEVPFKNAGFLTTSHTPIFENSRVVIILAQKPVASQQANPLPQAPV